MKLRPAQDASTTEYIRSSSRQVPAARSFKPEPGVSAKLVFPAEIVRLIRAGRFKSQLHIGALLLAELHGFIALPRGAADSKQGHERDPEALEECGSGPLTESALTRAQ